MKKGIRSRYPDNWPYISSYIRFERAKNKCEKCGLTNGLIIRRRSNGKYDEINFEQLEMLQQYMEYHKLFEKQALKRLKLTKVHISVAHLDRNESNNDFNNLLAMCQRCHFLYDKANNLLRAKMKSNPNGINHTLDFPEFTD